MSRIVYIEHEAFDCFIGVYIGKTWEDVNKKLSAQIFLAPFEPPDYAYKGIMCFKGNYQDVIIGLTHEGLTKETVYHEAIHAANHIMACHFPNSRRDENQEIHVLLVEFIVKHVWKVVERYKKRKKK